MTTTPPLSASTRAFTTWLPGLLLGCLLSWPLLAGNAQGQVNLLAVLALLVAVPLLTLCLTLLTLWRGQSLLPPSWWQSLPLLPARWKEELRHRRLQGTGFWWLLHAGQWLMLGFSMGSVMALGLLLLFTDLHFVWRSTLLRAEHLQPILQWIAWPWSFWQAAQPDLELLRLTQANRLVEVDASAPFSRWWAFVLAAQLTYVVVPRLLLALWSARHLRQMPLSTNVSSRASHRTAARASLQEEWPENAHWVDAAWLPEEISGQLPEKPAPLGEMEVTNRPWVVVVRAWEPPLAELADQLRSGQGLILPVDWQGNALKTPAPPHVDEWQRFAASMHGWKILQWRARA